MAGQASMAAGKAVVDWMGMASKAALDLDGIESRVAAVMRCAEVALDTLADADGLLQEETDAAGILDADLLALVPAGACGALLRREATVDAAAKLVAGVLSWAPVLPGAIRASRDLVASVYVFRPPVVGLLQDARVNLRITIDDNAEAADLFSRVTAALAVQPDLWQQWRRCQKLAFEQGNQARLRLQYAVSAAAAAQSVHPLCVTMSPQREEHMEEAKQSLEIGTYELVQALEALRKLRRNVKLEEEIVQDAINDAPDL